MASISSIRSLKPIKWIGRRQGDFHGLSRSAISAVEQEPDRLNVLFGKIFSKALPTFGWSERADIHLDAGNRLLSLT